MKKILLGLNLIIISLAADAQNYYDNAQVKATIGAFKYTYFVTKRIGTNNVKVSNQTGLALTKYKGVSDKVRGSVQYKTTGSISSAFRAIFSLSTINNFNTVAGKRFFRIDFLVDPDGKVVDMSVHMPRNIPLKPTDLYFLEQELKSRVSFTFDHASVKAAGGGYFLMSMPIDFAKVANNTL